MTSCDVKAITENNDEVLLAYVPTVTFEISTER